METGSQAERTLDRAAAGRPREGAGCGAGQARPQLVDPVAPHSCIDRLGGTVGERNRPRNPGLQQKEIKPQTSD